MLISPGGTHTHTCGMIPCTPMLSQVIYYKYKTNCNVQYEKRKRKQGDKWIHAHQSKSAAYTSGRVPCFPVQDRLVVLDVPAL